MTVQIHGHAAPGFEPVLDAFRANFEERGEVGAAFAAYQDGELVVDLWAGLADTETQRPWERDTMAVIFSATKGLSAVAFLMLEDRGILDLDQPVAFYWPEFGRDGKDAITVRQLLNHRSGLSAIDTPLDILDFHDLRKVEAALVRQTPMWTPGTAQGYGATTWGMYAQSLFRRLTGETLGVWLKREVFEPLEADVWLGTPDSERARVSTLYPVNRNEVLTLMVPKMIRNAGIEGPLYRRVMLDKTSDSARAFLNPSMGKTRLNRMNDPEIQRMELPWMNGISTARGMAKVYGALGMGGKMGKVRLVKKAAIQRVAGKQSWTNHDRVLGKPLGYTQGFLKEEPTLLSPHEAAFGHTGAGGAVGLADPTHNLGFAYVMNKMDHHLRSPRCIALCHAMYESLDGFT